MPEYKIAREADTVALEYVSPEQVTIRKKFFFPPTNEKKDNFVAKLDVDFTNNGAAPYANPGYFLGIGSAARIHRNDYPSYTRLVWLVGGHTKGIDVGWFAGGGGFFGMGQHPAASLPHAELNAADWVAASNQFFTTLVVPLTGKADAVWGKRFEIDPAERTMVWRVRCTCRGSAWRPAKLTMRTLPTLSRPEALSSARPART